MRENEPWSPQNDSKTLYYDLKSTLGSINQETLHMGIKRDIYYRCRKRRRLLSLHSKKDF